MTYTLTPEAFRAAHPELAARSWIYDRGDARFICWFNSLLGKGERIQCDVELCSCCDLPADECEDQLVEVVGDPLLKRRVA